MTDDDDNDSVVAAPAKAGAGCNLCAVEPQVVELLLLSWLTASSGQLSQSSCCFFALPLQQVSTCSPPCPRQIPPTNAHQETSCTLMFVHQSLQDNLS